jgi:hypothetical protein
VELLKNEEDLRDAPALAADIDLSILLLLGFIIFVDEHFERAGVNLFKESDPISNLVVVLLINVEIAYSLTDHF